MSFVVDTDTCSAYIKGHPLAYTVVSHNATDFQNVPGLTVVDWLVP